MTLRSRLLWLALLTLLLAPFVTAAQQDLWKVKRLFEEVGCTNCHDNSVAPDFEATVKKVEEWAAKYPSLDEAVKSEYKRASTYDEMMKMMKRYTPGLSEEDYKVFYSFFAKVFEEAKKGKTTPVTVAETPTPIVVAKPKPTRTLTQLPRVAVPSPAEEAEPMVRQSLAVGILLEATGFALLALIVAKAERRS